MKILIQNGHLLDPASGFDAKADLAIADGKVVAMGQVSKDFHADKQIDASNCWVIPGLVDACARLGEPGHEHEGMLESELTAAVAGGGHQRGVFTRHPTSA
jgi:dihydroorotase